MLPLLDQPHHRARTLLTSGAPVYLLVNPVEYHGPHLSLHNDRLISLGLVQRLHARFQADHDWPLLLAADLEIGVEPVPGPGSRAVPFQEVRRAVVRACDALADLGAQKIVIMTFHGAPLHSVALHAGVAHLHARGVAAVAPTHLVVSQLFELDGAAHADAYASIPDPQQRAIAQQGMATDFHGGFVESSLSLHLAPASVSDDIHRVPHCPDVQPLPAVAALARAAASMGRVVVSRQLRTAAWAMAWQQLRPFPGYTGWPSLATPQAGTHFAAAVLDAYQELCLGIFDGTLQHPAPPMAWLKSLTLGGRLAPPAVRVADIGIELHPVRA